MEPGPHYCTGCGEMHGGKPPVNPEVEIARINREADVEIARIQRGEVKVEAEAEIAVAEAGAEAEVAAAEATAETVAAVLGAGGENGGEAVPPVVIEAPAGEIPAEEEPSITPKEEHEPPPPAEHKSKLSYWP